MTKADFLLYPLGGYDERPTCEKCDREMRLAKFYGTPAGPEFSVFLCGKCRHTETFVADSADYVGSLS